MGTRAVIALQRTNGTIYYGYAQYEGGPTQHLGKRVLATKSPSIADLRRWSEDYFGVRRTKNREDLLRTWYNYIYLFVENRWFSYVKDRGFVIADEWLRVEFLNQKVKSINNEHL